MTALATSTVRGGFAKIGFLGASEGIFGDEEPADNGGKEAGGDQGQPLLDEAADRLAIDAQQLSLEEEARAPRDNRQRHEHEEIIAGEARGYGHDLVGNRRHALDQDDPRAP